jgi:acetyl-CoA carboxylase biotin carboxyl carrier protein
MNIKEVKDLIHEVLQSDIREFELENTGTRLRLKRGFPKDSAIPCLPNHPGFGVPLRSPLGDPGQPAYNSAEEMTDNADGDLHVITSPIVGTVYCSPTPGSEPFVKLGDQIRENSVLCIVEAMKLMNEIPSDVAGEIAHIFVENGTPVEFGQKLFAIRPSK